MPRLPIKVNDIVKRGRLSLREQHFKNVFGRVVEICQNPLFVNVVWDNDIVPCLERKKNLQCSEPAIPQTPQKIQKEYYARNASKIQKAYCTRKKVLASITSNSQKH